MLTLILNRSLVNGNRVSEVLACPHRLSTIASMYRLIVLDEGCIAEEGAHALLYAWLWAHQSGGFIRDHAPVS